MAQVKRFSQVRMDAGSLDENGFLRAKATATRIGVFTYVRPDGSLFRELRLPEEVFNPDSISTLKMVPVTLEHPRQGLVNPENAKTLQVGFTGDPVENGNYLDTEIVVTDKEAIEAVNAGKRETSCGYTCNLDETPGEWQGQAYDAIQRNIRYNHLAIVDRGRAGSSVRLHLDSLDAVEQGEEKEGNKKMAKIKLGDKSFEVSDELKEAFDAYTSKMKEDMKKKDEDMKKKEDEAVEEKKKADSLQARVDAIDEQEKAKTKTDSVEQEKARFDSAVKARVELVKLAEKNKVENFDSMENKELKVALIKKTRETFDAEGKSDEYIEAAFDMAKDQLAKDVPASQSVGASFIQNNDSQQQTRTSEQARADAIKADQELWKKSDASSKV